MNGKRNARLWMGAALAALAAAAGVGTGAVPDASGGAGPRHEILIPAVSFSAQGGGEVSKQEAKPAARPDPGLVHFWHTPGHWLQWTVEAPAAGEYEVTLRYAAKHDVRRALEVNGQAPQALQGIALKRTGRWGTFAEAKLPAKVTLKPGVNTLRMTCLDEASVRLQTITLSAGGAKDIVVRAADYAAEGGGRAQVLTAPQHGSVTKWTAEKHWLEWTFEAPAAGEYAVALHYAADGYCPREMQINSQPVKGLEAFIPPYTGDERQWTVGRLPGAVTLKAGQNTLRLTALGGQGRGVPAIGGPFALSAIRLTSPPGDGADAVKIIELTDAIAEQKRHQDRKMPDIPPAPLGPPLVPPADAVELAVGKTARLGGRTATFAKVDVLPYVENEFTKRFVFANYDNPRLHELRKRYAIDEVIAPGKTEFEKQLLLMKWAWDQWDFGHAQELYNTIDPFRILDEAKREHKFQCMHSGAVLLTTSNSLGWVARPMAIPQHTFTEIWSNELRKWVQFDATSNYYPEKDGHPLNTYEHRQALLRQGGGVMRGRMTDEGLVRSEQSASYGRRLLFVGYIPNTNLLVRGPMYGSKEFFITKDELCEGRSWHTRDCPPDPAKDPYFPINQAALALSADGEALKVTLGTMTPNFREFQVRSGDGEWKASPASFAWKLRPGTNTLQARSVNKFGVAGPVSTVELKLGDD